jgi:glycosyltransferase involved in cell wall biosynthesis
VPTIHLYHEAIMETKKRTRFGVVIPAFNAASIIESTLDAVASQDHVPTAVIVVIDGPDPILEQIVARHPSSPEVLVLPENSGGPSRPRNIGADRIRAQHELDAIWFMDDDDLPASAFLGVMDVMLRDHPNAAMVATSFSNWLPSDAPPDPHLSPAAVEAVKLDLDWYLQHTGALLLSFAVIRVDALDRLDNDGGRFHPKLPNNQDYQFFIRLMFISECRRIPWKGGAYRIHDASLSADRSAAWDCRARADLLLANWFAARGARAVSRRFIASSGSAARRAAKEVWHAGRRAEAASRLLRRSLVSLDPKAVVVLFRLVIGVERPSGARGQE